METKYKNIHFIESELDEFYTKNKKGKGGGFGRRLIELYADAKYTDQHKELIKQRDELLMFANAVIIGISSESELKAKAEQLIKKYK